MKRKREKEEKKNKPQIIEEETKKNADLAVHN